MKKLAFCLVLMVALFSVTGWCQNATRCQDYTLTGTGRTEISPVGGFAENYPNQNFTYRTVGSPDSVSLTIEAGNQSVYAQTPFTIIPAVTDTTGANMGSSAGAYRYWWVNLGTLSGGTAPKVILTACFVPQPPYYMLSLKGNNPYIAWGSEPVLHTYAGGTSDGSNTFGGLNSGNFTMAGAGTTGSYNTAFGNGTLLPLTTGYANGAFADNALGSLTTGFRNFGGGYDALYSCTDCFDNNATGADSLKFLLHGNSNNAYGVQSLQNYTGDGSACFGDNCASSSTTGPSIAGFGSSVLLANTTGGYHACFGAGSCHNTTTGNGISALGITACQTNTTGSNDTCVGGQADVASGTLSNAFALGYQATVSASNTGVIGNASVTDVYFGSTDGLAAVHTKVALSGIAYASLGTPADGFTVYCSDCDAPASPGAGCTSVGAKAGAEAHRIRGAWLCF